jgi:hypothetical protein
MFSRNYRVADVPEEEREALDATALRPRSQCTHHWCSGHYACRSVSAPGVVPRSGRTRSGMRAGVGATAACAW